MPDPERKVPTLTTERLVLRPLSELDIPAWFARASDRDAASLAGDPVPDSIAAGEEWLARSRRNLASGARLQWGIDRREGPQSIGTISLNMGAPGGAAALGFVLGRAFWGQGLATEAAQEILRYAFEVLELRQVEAQAISRNFQSLRILAKLGFVHINSDIDGSDGEPFQQFSLRPPRP